MHAKKNKTLKTLVAVLSMVLVICLTVAGTLAYLKAETTPVINTFSPSNINLTLEESNVDGGSETANTYKMVPGTDISKDPKVTVTADIDCYVFVKVEKSTNFDTYMNYTISDWTPVPNETNVYYREVSASADEDNDGKNNVEAFYVLDGKGEAELKNGYVTVKPNVTKDMMNGFYEADGITVKAGADLPELTFTAYAIQQAGFETNPEGAWDAAQGQQNG